MYWWIIFTSCIAVATKLLDHIRRANWVDNLQNKCVFITGCDSGFGNALARRLVRRGVFVFAGCLSEEGRTQLQDVAGARMNILLVDVTNAEHIERAVEYVQSNLPPGSVLWAVVNNAGIVVEDGPLEFTSLTHFRKAMEVNCLGMVEVVRQFLPLLKKSKGRIVNMTSMIGEIPFPQMSPYAASKFAATAVSEALRHEKAIWGIKVATILPGLFKTPIVDLEAFERKVEKQWDSLDPKIRSEYGEVFHETYVMNVCKDVPERASSDLHSVLDAYEHALFSYHPHAKYYPGTDVKVLKFIQQWMPGFVMDKIQQLLLSRNVPGSLR